MDRITRLAERQKEFQRIVGFPIDSISEADRNDMSEKYVFKLIEEAVELRKEFPSVVNPWSKKQKPADVQRVKEEFSDVLLFLMNIAIVWRFKPEEVLEMVEKVQDNNFLSLKRKKMDLLNSDILKIPGRVSGIGQGNMSPKYVFVGMNPGKDITQGYKFWSIAEDGSSKILLPILQELGIYKDSYFTNVVKCTTPNNSEPGEAMTEFYKEFLVKEIEILQIGNPDLKIVTLGRWASDKIEVGHFSLPHPAVVSYGSLTEDEYRDTIKQALT